MKNCIRLFFIGIFYLCSCSTFSFAQNVDSTNIYDSVKTNEKVSDDNGNLSNAENDTALKRFEFDLTYDSINAYKSQREFAYIKYLDSLLRKTKGLAVDTFSFGDNKNLKNKKRSNYIPSSNTGYTIMDSLFVKFFLWILALGFIVFVLYRLFLTESIFKRTAAQHPLTFTQQQEESMLDPSSYEKLINDCVTNNEFRIAIRYLYLQTLQKLSISGFIFFSPDKTNYEYVKELSGKPQQNEFATLTRNYEYVWYGKFEIGSEVFHKLQNDFKQYHKKL